MTLSKYFFLFAFAFNILFIPLDKNFYTFTEAKTYIFHIFIIFSFLSLLINQVIREDFSLQRFEYIGVSLKEIIKNPLYSFFFTVILIIFGIICSTETLIKISSGKSSKNRSLFISLYYRTNEAFVAK